MAFPTIATIASDLHGSTESSGSGPGDRSGFIRHYGSRDRRLGEIVSVANSSSSDLLVLAGDNVDSDCADGSKLSNFTSMINYLDANLNCDFITTIGNHIWTPTSPPWDGEGDAPSMSDYFDALDASTSEGAKANYYGPDSEAYSFSYTDINGMLWVVVLCPVHTFFEQDDPYDYLDWLDTRLQAAASAGTPCCVVTHVHLWQNSNNSNPNTLRISDTAWSSLQTIFDDADTLQCVFGGHQHAGGAWMKRKGVWFIDVEGSVSMPPNQTDTANAYMVVTINPQQIWTPNGMKAQVRVVPYGLCRVNKPEYDKFIVC